MKKAEIMGKVSVKITSEKWGGKKLIGSVIEIPSTLLSDFVKYKYGEVVKMDDTKVDTPEDKAAKKEPKLKTKKA